MATTSSAVSAPMNKKRKFEDEAESPGAGLSAVTGLEAVGSSDAVEPSEAAPKPKKKKVKGLKDQAEVFAFNSTDLRSRQKPVSITDLRHVALSLVEYTPAQDKPKFLGLPSKAAARRVAVLCIPGITPDVIGMASPPTFTVPTNNNANGQQKLHPRSLFVGPAASNITSGAPKALPSAASAPAFPLAFARGPSDTQLPALSKLFSHGLPTRAEGEGSKLYDQISSFLLGPAKIAKKDTSKPDASLFGEQSTTLESLILSPAELAKEGLESLVRSDSESLESSKRSPSLHRIANGWGTSRSPTVGTEGWVEAPAAIIPTSDNLTSKIEAERPVVLALDCEMVKVKNAAGIISDKALARIAVVDFWTEELLMDELVKPEEEIVDYATQWSGMTSSLLSPITTSISDIQSRLLTIMKDSNAILIGHHISNDLQALRLAHARCIDTSVIYQNLQRPSSKPSLKWLAQRWLGRSIQAQGQTVASTRIDEATGKEIIESVPIVGQRPEEDARACIGLVKMKVEQGLAFGKVAESKTSIFQRVKNATGGAGGGAVATAYVGADVHSYGTSTTTSVDCEEEKVLENVAQLLQTHDFVFGRVHFLAKELDWILPPASADPNSPSTTDAAHTATAFETFNSQIRTFTSSLPPCTALIIYTGCSDPRPLGALNKRKAVWDAKIRSGIMNDAMPEEERWTSKDGEMLEKACEAAKAGLAFFCVTRSS